MSLVVMTMFWNPTEVVVANVMKVLNASELFPLKLLIVNYVTSPKNIT